MISKLFEKPLTIGCDPEFCLIQPDGRVKPANQYIKNGDNPDILFGHDGHHQTAELRTLPTDNPKDQVSQLKKILEDHKSKHPHVYNHDLVSQSNKLSLGGHIHFGHKLLRPECSTSVYLSEKIATNLDNLLAFPTLFIEDVKISKHRRTEFGYGALSDIRDQPWGFEYRTLPSFIASRKLTSIMFYLGYSIAEATMFNKFKSTNISKINCFDVLFKHQGREFLRPFLSTTFKELKTLPRYKQKDYKTQTDRFITLVKKEKDIFKTEIKKGWNIEFNIEDFWNVDKIEEIILKISKLLVKIHKEKIKSDYKVKFTKGSFLDLGCRQISETVNIALNKIIHEEVLNSRNWTQLYIYGLDRKKGNKIYLGINLQNIKEMKKTSEMLMGICNEFRHKTRVSEIGHKHSMTPYSVGLGRKLREENLLLSEILIIVYILMLNKDLYKNTEKIKGKEKRLYLTNKKVIKPIITNLKDVKEFKVNQPLLKIKKLNYIPLPIIFDMNKTVNELRDEILQMSGVEKDGLSESIKRFVIRSNYLSKNRCISNCTGGFIMKTPMKELCTYHIISKLHYTIKNNFNTRSMISWTKLIQGDKAKKCKDCGKIEGILYFCSECKICQTCCGCVRCQACNEDREICTNCSNCSTCCGCPEFNEYRSIF